MATFTEVEALSQRAAKAARAGASTQQVYEELREVVVALRDDPSFPDNLSHLLQTDRAAGQFALRTCRSTFSRIALDDERDQLLFAFPCQVSAPLTSLPLWKTLAAELQGWVALNCVQDARIVVAPYPLATAELAGSSLNAAEWLKELATAGALTTFPLAASVKENTPALWLVALTGPAPVISHMDERLAQPRAPSQEFLTLKNRLEQLAEEKQAHLQLFPPAALVNSFSLSRIAHFRTALRVAIKKHASRSEWSFVFDGDELLELTPEGDTAHWGTFPEETFEDIQAMLLAASTAHGIKLKVLRQSKQMELAP